MSVFSKRHKFSEWPCADIPAIAGGVYVVWDGGFLIHCGMAGRHFERVEHAVGSADVSYGLLRRLASHASGRLIRDQFCLDVANHFVVPSLTPQHLARFASGELSLDSLTRAYINTRFEYQFALVQNSAEADALEKECREGLRFGVKPLLIR